MHKTGPIATPVAPGPSGALIEKLDACLERRLDFTLFVVLDPSLPLMSHQPPSHEIVVIGVENILSPLLIFEAIEKIVALENFSPVCASAARHTRSSAVDVVGCRYLEVPPLNVSRAQPVEDLRRKISANALNTLAGADAAHPIVLERGKEPTHEGHGPLDIIVSHDRNRCFDMVLFQRFADLEPLVRLVDVKNLDRRGVRVAR